MTAIITEDEQRAIDEALADGRLKRIEVAPRPQPKRPAYLDAPLHSQPKIKGPDKWRPGRGGKKTRIAIWDLIQWAFQCEMAGLNFDELEGVLFGAGYVSSTFRIMQHEQLGCSIDGGGRSACHPDADTVVQFLAVLPGVYGGRRMALRIAELARAGQVPDPMAGAKPKIEPKEWARNPHGQYAKTEFAAHYYVTGRGGRRLKEFRLCPIRWINSQKEIDQARNAYNMWWMALLEMQLNFRGSDDLTAFKVTPAMPPATPWKETT